MEKSFQLDHRRGLYFPLLSDPDRRIIVQYGLADKEKEIAVPTVIIVGRDGRVRWKHVGKTVMDRPDWQEIHQAIDAFDRS